MEEIGSITKKQIKENAKKRKKKKPTEHAMMTQFVICTNPINELPRGFANVFADQSELVLRVGAGKDGPAPNELR